MDTPRKAVYLRYNRTSKGRFRYGLARAKRKGLPWTLALPEYKFLIDNPCYYCDGPLDQTGISLDRIDSSLGYTRDNVVPCCGQCNRMKGADITCKDMLIIRKIMRVLKGEL